MKLTESGLIAEAVLATLISPNESDRNGESANVVDGLFAIARGLQAIARNLERLGPNESSSPFNERTSS